MSFGILLAAIFSASVAFADMPTRENTTIDGYRGIWFALGQKSQYGDKYSGGLATYTMKHNPVAIYSPEANKTFFVYGGTPSEDSRHLLCMIGVFDHRTGQVTKPTVVYDKRGVDDPHDNPSILIDNNGYIWVFVSGRSIHRPGFKYRSIYPYDISGFEQVTSEEMTYPQPMYIEGEGFFHFFTKYVGVRRLFFETSRDGITWSQDQALADIRRPGQKRSGHYQFSTHFGKKIMTCFNRHPNGDVDRRTNIYYLQSEDFGRTWTTADGRRVDIPVTDSASICLVREYESKGRNVYIKDINYDALGNPVILYLTSDSHLPGPLGGTRQWSVVWWDGREWIDSDITTSTHNYDSGSIWIEDGVWTVIAPTLPGPQHWGTGGEIAVWKSGDCGRTWTMTGQLTGGSPRNHGYVRRPLNAKDPFYGFWADGDADNFGISYLYYCNSKGDVYRLPYDMDSLFVTPLRVVYPALKK